MVPDKKVYCANCKHLFEFSCEYGTSVHCQLDNHTTYEDSIRPQKVYGTEKQLRQRNKNHDCADFTQAKWFNNFWTRMGSW